MHLGVNFANGCRLIACMLAVFWGAVSLHAAATETVTLRLKWKHQFQFAGFYAAQAKGYYAEEGLAVNIVEAQRGAFAIDAVLAGDAQFGVSDSSVVLHRLRGQPLVACAAILQHAPEVIMSRLDRNIRTPADLVNTRLMLSGDQGMAMLRAMLLGEGVSPDSVTIIPHTWTIDALIEKRVDAMNVYASEEPYRMRLRGVEPALLRSIDYGVDFYGDTLFTTEHEIAKYPERTAAFVRASLRGWDYALKNPGEISDLILTLGDVRARGVTRETLLAEAEAMKPFILSDVIQIGHMNPGRWEKIAHTFVKVGMAPRMVPLEGFLFDPQASRHTQDTRRLVQLGAIALGVAALILLWNLQIRTRVRQRTRELADEITHRNRIEADLRASEERFRLMFTGAATGIAVLSPEGRFLQANPSYCATIGYTEAELQTMDLVALIHADDRGAIRALMQSLSTGPDEHFIAEVRCIKKNGVPVWKRASVSFARSAENRPASIIVVAEDVNARHSAEIELARVNRAQRMLGACNEALIRAESESDLLHAICQIAVEIGGYRLAWVGFALLDEARTIRPVAQAGVDNGYLAASKFSWNEDLPSGSGPAGRTIREGRPTVFADIETDDRFLHWRESARLRGYRGVIGLPLGEDINNRGLLALYSGEVLTIGPDEIKLLQQLADDLAFGLNTLRTRAERQKTQEALITVARAVSASVGGEFFRQLTRSMVSALGADIGVISKLDPDNPAQARTLVVVADGTHRDNFTYPLTGSPCENISPGHSHIVPRDVQTLYPESQLMVDLGVHAYVGHPLVTSEGRLVGIMAVLYRHPLEQTAFIASSLQILATRAASELDRQQVDARLREQAALLDKAQDAIIVRTLDHHIAYWNKSAERLYGWTAHEAVGSSIASLLYKEPDAFLHATDQVITKGEWVGELHQIDKQGRTLIVECRWNLVRDDDGTPRSILAINTDISEKKNLEHQFLRAQRMESIGTLAGGIAHDLNNVLAPVIMAVDLLKLTETAPHKLNLLNNISTSARRGADMVGQVLSFARGMDGRRVDIQLRHLIDDIEKIIQDTFPKNIRVTTRSCADLWVLAGDPTQLHQVMLNLCVNARDALPDGGHLTLTADNHHFDKTSSALPLDARPGPYIVLQVEDTGRGIPAAIIDKIFDPFFTTKEIGKGTGLGLSTTLAIVKGHGGHIQVSSEPDSGTRFRVFLPAQSASFAPANLRPGTRSPLPRGGGELVLVIDDEIAICQVTRQMLEAFGYRVLIASDGAVGAELYAAHRADIAVVLMDMMMPVMDGPATIQALLKIDSSVRIIAASGITANATLARSAGPCVRDFLAKPYSAETLLKSLRHVLDTAAG